MPPCDKDVMEHRWNEIDKGKLKYSGGKTCPSATLSTTNPTRTDPRSRPGLRGESPATNRLSNARTLKAAVTAVERLQAHASRPPGSVTVVPYISVLTNYIRYHISFDIPVAFNYNKVLFVSSIYATCFGRVGHP